MHEEAPKERRRYMTRAIVDSFGTAVDCFGFKMPGGKHTEICRARMNKLVKDNLRHFAEADTSFESWEDEMKTNVDQVNAIGEDLSMLMAPKRRRTDSATDSSSHAARTQRDIKSNKPARAQVFSSGWQNSTSKPSFSSQGSTNRDRISKTAPWGKGQGKTSSR